MPFYSREMDNTRLTFLSDGKCALQENGKELLFQIYFCHLREVIHVVSIMLAIALK